MTQLFQNASFESTSEVLDYLKIKIPPHEKGSANIARALGILIQKRNDYFFECVDLIDDMHYAEMNKLLLYAATFSNMKALKYLVEEKGLDPSILANTLTFQVIRKQKTSPRKKELQEVEKYLRNHPKVLQTALENQQTELYNPEMDDIFML